MPLTGRPRKKRGVHRSASLSDEEYDRRLALVRTHLVYASEHPGLADDLTMGRPIGGKAWNSFIRAICARNDEDYVNALLDVATEITEELNPANPHVQIECLRKVARNRAAWPMLVCRGTAASEKLKMAAKSLELGGIDGRKRKSNNPGPIPLLAEEILDRLREEIAQFDSPSVQSSFAKRKWAYHYICPAPPALSKSEEAKWRELAGVTLNIFYGPRSVRKHARANHLKQARENQYAIPQAQINSVTAQWLMAKERQEIDLQRTKFAWRNWDKTQRDLLGETHLSQWPSEPPPCILSYPMLRHYGGKTENGKGRSIDSLQTPEAVYNQVKKDVLKAVVNRLPQ